ncbi:hypothetical protein CL628_03275 [bacterium]|nr:hypothetical protein [bacterium]
MPLYNYRGRREASGEVVRGVREAGSHAELGQVLLQEGVLLTRYELQRKKTASSVFFSSLTSHVPVLERVLFARYFALMLRAGLDVKQALGALAEQTKGKPMKVAINGVLQKVDRGSTLADSMASFPNAFPELFVGFIRVGETTGRLQESLEILSEQLQKEYDLRRAVKGALLYPAVIISALVAVMFAMLVFVVPKLADVFEGFDVDLPLATRVLLGIGSFFEVYWWLALILLAALVAGVWFSWKLKSVRGAMLRIFTITPVLGSIIQQVNLARFTRNLSSLLRSGVSYVEALGILGENTPHIGFAAVFQSAQDHVKQGKLLSEHLVKYRRLFPPLVVNVIKVGEETGALDEVLEEIAVFYESEVDQVMRNLTSILEPILMVGIGLAVGALAISVISPIYNLVNVI